MCGVAGMIRKSDRVPVAECLSTMLQALRRRGPDSSGMALYRPAHGRDFGTLTLQSRPDRAGSVDLDGLRATIARHGEVHEFDEYRTGYVRAVAQLPFDDPELLGKVAAAIEDEHPDVQVFSMGTSLDLVKGVTDAVALFQEFDLDGTDYTHGIGHVRLATESRIDVAHSHPFWARPFPDVTVVHNGHLTNYHKLRRVYEQRGYRFTTDNDSEFISVYIAGQLHEGVPLDEAVRRSVDDLDGSFTYLVASTGGIAVARDRFGAKPCLVAESAEWIAIASEELALHEALGDSAMFRVDELAAGEARTWHV